MSPPLKSAGGVSDQYLQKLWRKCLLKVYGPRDFFSGKLYRENEVECHHIVYKSQSRVLRHDWHNGIIVSLVPQETKYHEGKAIPGHRFAHTAHGRHVIEQRHIHMDYLYGLRSVLLKDYLMTMEMTEAELEEFERDQLREKIEKIGRGRW